MDGAAVAIAGENYLPIVIFQADQEGAVLEALLGKRGSLIGGEE
jgi:uridylate kinase